MSCFVTRLFTKLRNQVTFYAVCAKSNLQQADGFIPLNGHCDLAQLLADAVLQVGPEVDVTFVWKRTKPRLFEFLIIRPFFLLGESPVGNLMNAERS